MVPYFVDKSQCSHHTIFPGVDIYTMAGDAMMLSLVDSSPTPSSRSTVIRTNRWG
jgi:hypothetical protein